MSSGTPTLPASRWPLLAAVAYTAFPIYGSLIPFRWSSQPLAPAWEQFLDLLSGPLTITSRADFAANILLAIPLALLWLGALVGLLNVRRPIGVGALAALVWAGASAFALGLEFSQIFFSGRQPAVSDVVAQSIGAGLGVVAWAFVPRSFWRRSPSPDATRQRATALYLTGLVLYALLPLDLTVSQSEIAAKWVAGQIHLMPFGSWQGQPFLVGLVDFLLDVLIWALAAVLLRRSTRLSAGLVSLSLVVLATLLEVAQILVLSRVVDTTDIVAAAVGTSVAGFVRRPGLADNGQPGARSARWGPVWPVLVGVGILLVQTWPFGFVTDPTTLRPRFQGPTWLPFASYATATELYLVTNVLRRLAIYALFAWLVAWQLPSTVRTKLGRAAIASAVTAGLAAIVEGLQVFLPGRVVDTGDILLAGVAGALAVALSPQPSVAAPRSAPWVSSASRDLAPRPIERGPPAAVPVPLAAGAAIAILTVVLIAAYTPGVPYNLRELLAPGGVAWPAVGVTLGALLVFGSPAWLARRAAPGPSLPLWRTLAMLCGLPLAMAVLLALGAPRESVHDIVGSPVLDLTDPVELIGRLWVLLLGLLWALAFGVAMEGSALRPGGRGGSLAHLILHGLWVVPLWHLVVVTWAATDNLTELMAGGGGLKATSCLFAYGVAMGASSSAQLRALTSTGGWGLPRATLAVALSLVLGWLLLQAGTEQVIIKYGQVFSALQFMLSPDRESYATGAALMMRFAVAHLAVLATATAGLLLALAWPGARGWPAPVTPPAGRPPVGRS